MKPSPQIPKRYPYDGIASLDTAITEIQALGRICEISGVALSKEVGPIEKHIAHAPNLSYLERQDLYREHAHDWVEISYTLPRLLWYAQFTLAYSLLEKAFNDICFRAHVDKPNTMRLQDVAGTGIHRARIYLTRIHGVDRSLSGREWAAAKHYGEIRNRIVHNGGLFVADKENSNSLYCRSKALSDVQFDEAMQQLHREDGEYIFFKEAFVQRALSHFRSLVAAVDAELRALKKK